MQYESLGQNGSYSNGHGDSQESHKPQITPQKCPICQAQREVLVSNAIMQGADRAVIHVMCAACHSALMVFATQNDVGMVTFGVMVDVSHEEAETVFNQSPVSCDDVLGVHHQLKKVGNVSVMDFISQ